MYPLNEATRTFPRVAALIMFWLLIQPAASIAQTCDLQVTSLTGFPGGNPTDMEFSFCNAGPQACTNTQIRMPVNFPGTTQSTFAAGFYNVTSVEFLPPLNPAPFLQCSSAGDMAVCNNVEASVGACYTIRVRGTPVANASNEGCISAYWSPGGGSDPNPGNNPHRSCYPIGSNNIIVEKSFGGLLGGWAWPGEIVEFPIRVINTSSGPVTGQFRDSPPNGFTFVGSVGNPSVSCNASGGVVNCSHAGGWPAGETNFVLRFQISTSISLGNHTNVCTFANAPGGWSVDDSNCQATVQVRRPRRVEKLGPSNVQAGAEFDWTIRMSAENPPIPPATPPTFSMTDVIPSAFTVLSATTPHGTCNVAGQTVSCSGSFPSWNHEFDITIRVRANAAGTYQNTCSATITAGSSNNMIDLCQHTVVVTPGQGQVDLEATKTGSSPFAVRGQPYSYVVRVTNHGPNTGTAIQMVDYLPTGFNATSVTGQSPMTDCSIISGGTQVYCSAQNFPVGWSVDITINGTIAASAPATLTNTCETLMLSPNDVDPNPANNSTTHCRLVTPVESASVQAAKTVTPGPIYLGQSFTYTIAVTNPGQVAASNVVITDSLPAGVQFLSVNSPAPFACVHNGQTPGTVTCTAPSLAAGASASIQIQVRANATGTHVNTCTSSVAGAAQAQPNCTVPVTIQPGTVTVTKSDSQDPVFINQVFTYGINVRNESQGIAPNVSVVDPLPNGLEFVSVGTPAPFACSHNGQTPGTVTCTTAALAVGAIVTIPIQVRAIAPGLVTNTCQVSVGGASVTTQCTETTVVQQGTLTVTKSDSRDPVPLGVEFDYRIRVQNTSGGSAHNVQLSDPLPPQVAYVSLQAPAPFTCQHNGGNPGSVSCSATEVPVGTDATIIIRVRANALWSANNACTVSVGGATVTTQCQETTEIEPGQLDATKTDTVDPVGVGQEFDYVIGWSNTSEGIAPDATIVDTLPSATRFVSVSSDAPFACQHNGLIPGTVTCSAASVAPGQAGEVRIRVRAHAPGVATNTCAIGASGSTSVSQCNEQTTIISPALTMTKIDSVDPVWVGEEFDYVIAVTNTSTVPAINVEVVDDLPPGVRFVSASSVQFNCNEQPTGSGTVRCTSALLAAGASDDLVIRVRAAQPGLQFNACYATVGANGISILGECQEDTLVQQGRILVSKTDSEDPVYRNDPFTYTIRVETIDAGQAYDVRVVDPLPPGITFSQVTADSPFVCSFQWQTNQVTCEAAYLDGMSVYEIRIDAVGSASGVHTNICSVTLNGQAVPGCVEETTVLGLDVSLTKSHSANPVGVNQEFDYTIHWLNSHVDDLHHVNIIDELPAEVEFLAVEWSNGDDAVCWDTDLPNGSTRIECTIFELPAGSSGSITIRVRAPSVPMELRNECVGTSGIADVDHSLCYVQTEVARVLPTVTKTDSVDPVAIGIEFDYLITIANPSADLSTIPYTVVDTLPPEVAFVSVEATGGAICSYDAGVVQCEFEGLHVGAVETITIRVRAIEPGTAVNTCHAQMRHSIFGTESCVEDTTVFRPELHVSKTHSQSPVQAGAEFDYVLSWAYLSAHPSQQMTITDPIVLSTLISATADGYFSCDADLVSNQVECVASSLPPGAVGEITIRVRAPSFPVYLHNACVAASGNMLIDPEDCGVETVVEANVEVTKTDLADPVLIGATIEYVITIENQDPTDLVIEIVDPISPDVAFLSVSSVLDCQYDAGVVRCIGSIPALGSEEVRIEVQAPDTPGVVLNSCTAAVEAHNVPPSAGDRGFPFIPIPTPLCVEDTTVIELLADLQVTKTGPTEAVLVGAEFDYGLHLTNAGPDAATEVVLTDPLPAGTAFVSASGDGWACGHDGGSPGVVECARPVLDPEQTSSVALRVRAPMVPGPIENTCVVESATVDPNPSQDCRVTTIVRGHPALQASKTDLVDPVFVGQHVDYVIDVANMDTKMAITGVVVRDTLPAGMSYQSATGQGWSCGETAGSPGVVECTRADLLPGESSQIYLRAVANQAGEQINVCAAMGAETDPELGQPLCTESTLVRDVPDVVATKAGPTEPVMVGNTIDYLIEVVNLHADVEATQLVMTDTLPAGTQFLGAGGDGWVCGHDGAGSAGAVVCTRDALAPEATSVISLSVRAPSSPGTIVNVCELTIAEPDPTPGNPGCRAETEVLGGPDVRATKTGPTAPVLVGATIDYEIAVTNTDALFTATNVEVVDVLPAGTQWIAASGPGWACVHDGGDAGVVTCTRPELAPGETSVIALSVVAPMVPGNVVNTCQVSISEPDPTPADPGCSTTTVVREGPAVVVSKMDLVDPVGVGESIVYVLRAENLDTDHGVEALALTDTLPTGVTFVSAEGPEWTCAHDGGDPGAVTCTRPTLAALESSEVRLEVVAPSAPGSLENRCTATATGQVEVDDTMCVETTQVVENPTHSDLDVTKTAEPPRVQVGEQVTWTIRVTNLGPDQASDVTVGDFMPPGLEIETVTSSHGACVWLDDHVDCTIGDLDPDEVASVTILTLATEPGPITNVCVLHAESEIRPTRECRGEVIVEDPREPRLVARKSVDKPVVEIDEPFSYTITLTNPSEMTAAGVHMEDHMPAGLIVMGMPDACGMDGQTIVCEAADGELEAGGSVEFVFDVRASTALGRIRNVCVARRMNADGEAVPAEGTCEVDTTVLGGQDPEPPPPPAGGEVRPVPVNDWRALVVLAMMVLLVAGIRRRQAT